MIDPALLLLARLRFVAWFRKIRRSLSTPRGIAFFVIGCVIFAAWLLPAMLRVFIADSESDPHRIDPQHIRDVTPLIILLITLLMAFFSGGKFISFSPAEIDFLFPAPFKRRHIVLWKISVSAATVLSVALIISIVELQFASLWIAAFLGIWFAWLFAQSFAMLVILSRNSLKAEKSSLVIRFIVAAGFIAAAFALLDLLSPFLALIVGSPFSWHDFIDHSRNSLPARLLLTPFNVLADVFTAKQIWPDLLMWTGVSAAMISLVISFILQMDAYFIESSLRASEARQSSLQRIKRGGSPFGASKPIRSLRVPMFPWLRGAGPIAWRQIMLAIRCARGLLLMLLLIMLGVSPMIFLLSKNIDAALPIYLIGGAWVFLILPSILRFDFRGDLLHIQFLKTLPIPPKAIVIGQIIAPALILFLVVVPICVVIFIISPDQMLFPVLAALVAFPPLAFLLIGIENATFLLFPTAQTMKTPGDMSMMGRTMVIFFVKFLLLLIYFGALAVIGGIAYFFTHSWTVAFIVAWIALIAEAISIVPFVAQLFTRLDPASIDLSQ